MCLRVIHSQYTRAEESSTLTSMHFAFGLFPMIVYGRLHQAALRKTGSSTVLIRQNLLGWKEFHHFRDANVNQSWQSDYKTSTLTSPVFRRRKEESRKIARRNGVIANKTPIEKF